MMELIDYVIELTNEYMESISKDVRKKYGQFFTSKETALFMASLFDLPSSCKSISILDPGSGSGILSVAVIQRILTSTNIQKISLTCYETNDDILPLLKKVISWLQDTISLELDITIIEDNYITSQAYAYSGNQNLSISCQKYDIVISNPPYLKIGKSSEEALSMPDICHGAPNLYFLFMEMARFNLTDEGQMVFIVPRSWTSGAYFKKFREKFLSHVALLNIHLFNSRDKVFDTESVLQETMIIKAKKSIVSQDYITISTTNTNKDFANKTIFKAPYAMVVSNTSNYVYLITDEADANTIKTIHKWNDTLPTLGLKMKTGLTVDFRNKEVLRSTAESNTVPLFYPHHIKEGSISFPLGKPNEYILAEQSGLLQKNRNYLFVKRFTTKEESRRLQCGVYLAKHHPTYEAISTQNKINFITGLTELSEPVVYGLYVIMNSTLYDQYYRILNGSTQVNSTEINSIPMPPLNCIETMGQELLNASDMSEKTCNDILRRYTYD